MPGTRAAQADAAQGGEEVQRRGGAGPGLAIAYAPIGVIASEFILSDQGLRARATAGFALKQE